MSTAPSPLTCEQLSSFSPMDFLTPHYRQQLHASLTYLQRPAGTPLLHKGERSVAQYYLLEGRVSVDSGNGKQSIEGGSPQAHLPLNPGQHNPSSVRALTDVRLFAVERQLLERLLGWSQEAAYQVSSLGEMQVEASWRLFAEARIPSFRTPEAAVEAFYALSRYGQNQELLLQVPGPRSDRHGPDVDGARLIIEGMEQRGTAQVIRSQVPLSEMFGYATDLRSRTQGRATYTMQFDSYQQVPESIAEEIVKRVRGE